jgi:hypothetical protein
MSSAVERDGDEQLRESISANETLAEWGGVAVVFGLIVEVVLTAVYRHGDSIAEAWGPVGADALIALGVAAEILFARKARSKTEVLQRRSDEKIAASNARTAEAELRTEKIRSELSWRRLSSVEIATITKLLTVEFVGADPECNSFAHDIGTVFSQCGWTVLFMAASYFGEVAFGIRAPLYAAPDAEACGIARTSLVNAGISLTGHLPPETSSAAGSGENVSSPCAHIYVGPKPMPILE